MSLQEYHRKRDFARTREPRGKIQKSVSGRIFVIQKHAARRLHYDLRLEMDGVLKSWAVPKGPSYDPADKRLAVQVEDHPLEYGDFEGIIEPGQYGAGTVMVWDRGTWEPVEGAEEGLASGKLKFRLDGRKLKGIWNLVRLKARRGEKGTNWLLIAHDEGENPKGTDVTVEEPLSAKTGRSMEEIRTQADSTWASDRPSSTPPVLPGLKIGKKEPSPPPARGHQAPWPKSFSPQLATLVSAVPPGESWLHEIKFDGYRLLAMIRGGRTQMITRRGQNWTSKFGSLPAELSSLPVENAILDGEVVVQDPDGTTNFQKLQNSLKGESGYPLLYFVFDLPYYNGHDLSDLPLRERKGILEQLIRTYSPRIPAVQYSEHVAGSGERIYSEACRRGAEGIVSKRADSPYVQNRSRNWLKVKCIQRQEFVIGGFTDPGGTRPYFGSLLLGTYNEKKQLVYCGKVGTGFDARLLQDIHERLKKLEQDTSPFVSVKDIQKKGVHWTSPEVVAEVEFFNWTDDGRLRHPSFLGIREDKDPREVTREREVSPPPADSAPDPGRKRRAAKKAEAPPAEPLPLSHPNKVLYPEDGITKKDLFDYYTRISPWIMPELKGRPLTLVRCPEGIGGECFFQKHLGEEVPPGIQAVPIEEKEGGGLYAVAEDLEGLLSLVQLGVLEIHVWGSRVDHLEYPDRMVLDLDPSPEVSREKLVEGARFIKDWLAANDIHPFFKTTGGKGIHVVIPLKPTLNWDRVREISEGIAREVVRERPEMFIATMTKNLRKGKILVDYFRNTRGATAILPYSTRARPGAPVALPIFEKEVNEKFLSHPLGIREVEERLKKLKKNPWAGMK